MEDQYQILRYEMPGLLLFLYWFVGLLSCNPFPVVFNFELVALLIGLGLPLGYIIHQLMLIPYYNISHRESYKELPEEYQELEDMYQIVLLNACFFRAGDSKLNGCEIYKQCNARWSHYFARREAGIVSPSIAFVLFLISILFFIPQDTIISWEFVTFWWIIIFIISYIIAVQAKYVKKQIEIFETFIIRDTPPSFFKTVIREKDPKKESKKAQTALQNPFKRILSRKRTS